MADSKPTDDLTVKATTIADESLESTRRMLQMCEDSKEAGIKTLVMLDEQGEQLERIEEGMDRINEDMKDAEKNLEGLEKCCGLFVLPWKKIKNFEKNSSYSTTWKGNEDGKGGIVGMKRVADGGDPSHQSGFVTKITNDSREDEMEENIQQVSTMIGNLRNMAMDMGSEIENQNQQIERVDVKGLSNKERIYDANKRANKLLRN